MKLLITTSFSTTEIDVNDENKSVILGQIRKCMREHSELQIDTCSGAGLTGNLGDQILAKGLGHLFLTRTW